MEAEGYTPQLRGLENADAAREGEIIVLDGAVRRAGGDAAAAGDAVAGKIVVSTGVPLAFEGGKPGIAPVPEGSAAEQAQALLPGARVVGAFQNLSAAKLWGGGSLDQDVLVAATTRMRSAR